MDDDNRLKGSRILENLFTAGDIFCFLKFIIEPASTTGLGHDFGCLSTFGLYCLDVTGIVGSVSIIAVAGRVLGTTNVLARFVENTDITTAPLIPATRVDNSAATKAF